ncbi:pyrimidine dimer DNA glycosylase [Candidatus Berkelbacteria bacterium]|nr:pyrimidine dimer DNA glycosylase [Candidatus Berkelbacteria bacterium]
MRIWDIEPKRLCRKHLLGEHRELHALWSIISNDKQGYRNHPETKRWEGKLPALLKRHDLLVVEMKKRGYRHNSPIDTQNLTGQEIQDVFVNTVDEQEKLLTDKKCDCLLK